MNIVRLQKLFTAHLLAEFPEYAMVGRLAILLPLGQIVRGFYFDRMRTAESLSLFVFVQPLYVPAVEVRFSWGGLILQSMVREDDEPAAMKKVRQTMNRHRSFPERYSDAASIVRRARGAPWTGESNSEHILEYIAYSQVIAGQYAEARKSLLQLSRDCRLKVERNPHWTTFGDMAERSNELLEALATSPMTALKMLDEWTAFTKMNLGLSGIT